MRETRASLPALQPRALVRALLATAWCALAVGVRADVIDLKWTDAGRFEQSRTVAPGKFVELCGALAPGQAIQWSFEADRAVNFNIHYHVGKDVRYPAKQDQVTALQGSLVVDSAQDYCWMWVNKSALDARLALRLSKG